VNIDDLGPFFERLSFATIDHLRPHTQGHQEVVLCSGKTAAQVVGIAERLVAASGSFLATRADPEHVAVLRERFPRVEWNELGRTLFLPPDPEPPPTGRGTVLVITAGTGDLPVAEEAAVTLRAFRNRVARLTDVGVAGIHRLLGQSESLRDAAVIVVVADGGCVAERRRGLVKVPVIAVRPAWIRRRSVAWPRCSECSTPARRASPWSTSTTVGAPPRPAGSTTREAARARHRIVVAVAAVGDPRGGDGAAWPAVLGAAGARGGAAAARWALARGAGDLAAAGL
jgi:NCAIR mutase (PurE)-related protein